MKKLLMIFGLILGLTTITNANIVEAKAKVMTKEAAAKKAASYAEKAYKTKKTIKFTVRIKSSEKDVEKNIKELKILTGKAQWGKYAGGKYSFNKYGTVGYDVSTKSHPKKHLGETYKGVLTLKGYVGYGAIHEYDENFGGLKWHYDNFPYFKKICNHLEKVGKTMGPVEKAAYLDYWLGSRLGYHLASEEGKDDIYYFATPKRIWQGKAFGQCEVRASLFAAYVKLMGVKHVATVYIKKNNHLASAVRFEDGRIFWIDLGDTIKLHDDWENGKWISQADVDKANQYRAENNLDLPECTIESYLYDDFVLNDTMYGYDAESNAKIEFKWVGEGKNGEGLVESFKEKDFAKGSVYSKFAW